VLPMPMKTPIQVEASILSRVLRPDQPTLSRAAARAWLRLGFDESDKRRMRKLAEKARQGTLTADEQAEANGYERVGSWLGMLHSKARRSLRQPVQP
jgi:hypothetical protein